MYINSLLQHLAQEKYLLHSTQMKKTCTHPQDHLPFCRNLQEDRNQLRDSHAWLEFDYLKRSSKFETLEVDLYIPVSFDYIYLKKEKKKAANAVYACGLTT